MRQTPCGAANRFGGDVLQSNRVQNFIVPLLEKPPCWSFSPVGGDAVWMGQLQRLDRCSDLVFSALRGAGLLMDCDGWLSPGGGQQHMRHPFYRIHPQLVHQSGSAHSYGLGAVSVPGSSSGFVETSSLPGFVPATVAPRAPIISHPPTITYRPIRLSDLEVLQEIHEALFPIKYESEFFMNVVHGRGIISWAAVDTSRSDSQCDELIGFVTARIVAATDGEEMEMLGYEILKSERSLIYILTLGVIQPYRNSGIASALVWEVIQYANQLPSCRAVYLHVIAYNRSAIMFYQKNMFQCLRKLHNFYCIEGQYHDAYLYVYYVNGGRSPCSAIDFLTAATGYVRGFFSSMVTKLF